MLRKAKGWIGTQWMRVSEKTRDKISVKLWWIFTVAAALNAFTIIFYFEDPAHAPYVGAMVTVFAFFSFTKLRSTQDGYAQDAENKLSELHAQNFQYKTAEIKRDIEIESYNREREIHSLRREIKKISDGVLKKPQAIGFSLSYRDHHPAPRQPSSINQPIMRISNYYELCREYRRNIKRHRAYSGRLAKMEALAIIYGAAVSAFGGELIKFWNR